MLTHFKGHTMAGFGGPLEERIASRSGLTQLSAMEAIGMGSRRCHLEQI